MALSETPPILSRIVKTLVADARPEKIVLFGSYANGTADVDSDLDISAGTDWSTATRISSRATRGSM